MPTRDQLNDMARQTLHAGGPTKADLDLVDAGEGPIVVKDFSRKAAWVRLVGRIQTARECRAYRWLGRREGLTPFLGRIDAHALALGQIHGQQLFQLRGRLPDAAAVHRSLVDIVEGLHRSGLAHLDLRGRENILLDADGRLYILDLASAVWFRPGGWWHRMLFRWFRVADRAALLKWKQTLDAGPVTDAERVFLRRYGFWRALWPFNNKNRRRREVP